MERINGWITSGEACERLEIAWRTLYHLHRQSPDFPKPKKIGRTLPWEAQALDAWQDEHPKRQRKEDVR
ncbi:helix-turn-helix transcriptional regulator [Streptomyces sp. NPDC055059]